MSSPALKKSLNRILRELNKNVSKHLRKDIEKHPGQLFILDIDSLISECKDTYNLSVAHTNQVVKAYITKLNIAEIKAAANKSTANVFRFKSDLLIGKYKPIRPLPANNHVAVINNKRVADTIKRQISNLIDELIDEEQVKKGTYSGKITSGTKRDNMEGFQTAHGEFGYAVSTTRIMQITRMVEAVKLKNPELKSSNLDIVINEYKESFKLVSTLDLTRLITVDGRLKNEYVSILSNQSTKQNQIDSDTEQKTLAEFSAAIKKELDVLNQQSSPPLFNDIESILLHNFSRRKNLKVISSVPTNSSKIKRTSKSKASSSITKEQNITTYRNKKQITKKQKKARQESVINLHALIPKINENLHDQIRANMGSPRLNYRTGRFAHSAEVTNVITTPQGYPTIQYTYMKDPYQLFEFPGGSSRLATPDRDPRKIIDTSIRDIAKELLKFRFYTARV
jgi:hypothetical protein